MDRFEIITFSLARLVNSSDKPEFETGYAGGAAIFERSRDLEVKSPLDLSSTLTC